MKLDPVDISKSTSAANAVFEALRQAIIEGRLEEGEPLRQDEIARHFSTSRLPVREAINRLEEHGLVRTQRFKGAVVAGLSAEEAAEIFDFRALLEPEIIRDAVPRMDAALLAQARADFAAFDASRNPLEWGLLNRAFHDGLYSASKLTFFREAANGAMDRIDRYIRAQLVMSNGMERAGREHLAILEACEVGDAQLASELTRAHILAAKASLMTHFPVLSRA